MALPSSGALALSDFNTELGNSAGTQINLDASAVRALIGKSSGAVASFSDYYGASASYSATMTVGQLVVTGQYGSTNHGFNDSSESGLFTGVSGGDFGSLTSRDASSFSNSGATIEALFHTTAANLGIRLIISDNASISNSGWSTLTIGSSSLLRTDAIFSQGTGGQGFRATWQWSTASNLFGTSGTKLISVS